MRALIQRVTEASVSVEGVEQGRIGCGHLVLLGVHHSDTRREADFLVQKCLDLRVFNDSGGKMNLSLGEVQGSLLVVSQFTLYADCARGRRPSYSEAAPPVPARELYEYFVERCRAGCPIVQTGLFGAHMKVHLINDGPVTLLLEASSQA